MRAIIRKGIDSRWRTSIVSSTSSRSSPVSCSTDSSMPRTIRSASSSRPWMNSQRGLSGTLRRTSMIESASTPPSANVTRQPMSFGNTELRKKSAAPAPAADPTQ